MRSGITQYEKHSGQSGDSRPNMSLLQLPTEILLQIFVYVGSSYILSDLSRLTVCRQWYEVARIACFQEVTITQETVHRLMSSPYAESNLALVKDCTKTLNLDIFGHGDWSSMFLYSQTNAELQQTRTGRPPSWNPELGEACITGLNNHLLHLANVMKQSRKLRILSIETLFHLHGLSPIRFTPYLRFSTIHAFLSTTNLTSLNLDLCAAELLPQPSSDHHICTTIAALLGTLRYLRLRMRSICPEVLKPQHHITKLHLNEVIINLNLFCKLPLIGVPYNSDCCASFSGDYLARNAGLEKQAQLLAAQTANPRIIRILALSSLRTPPLIELQVFDALTGRYISSREEPDEIFNSFKIEYSDAVRELK
ncbi:unnamed protein product [Periconia digitata]|uniref:F-box domain-containing protein n=1 Tax=Periconia digitata TaxID=1303443 RepID=A0A9W4XM69_9PLEO|nr:unnamed protein product [Periconia digitata]